MKIQKTNQLNPMVIPLASSKSESNRVLIINALSANKSQLHNLSSARDTQVMKSLLTSDSNTYDVHDAGTVMRFLTAYLSIQQQESVIMGSPRMHQRPIGLLVEALRKLGADIEYLQEAGFPPLKIRGFSNQLNNELSIPGNISSQYISALLMIAPCISKGLKINLEGEIYSLPYIKMTLALMRRFGIDYSFEGSTIHIKPQTYKASDYTIESDWSGASYWFSMIALAENSEMQLRGLRQDSLQGDYAIVGIMAHLGVTTIFTEDGVHLRNTKADDTLSYDFRNCPDLAQTVIALAAAKRIRLQMSGLESLKIKETDRISAMATEVRKIGAILDEPQTGVWTLEFDDEMEIPEEIVFDNYEDHRMAMALAPLCLKYNIQINDPEVVKKSYPEFWDHLKLAGVSMISE